MKYSLLLFSIILIIIWFFNPKNEEIKHSNLLETSVDSVVNKIMNKTGRVFFTAEWCGGCKLTFKNEFLHESQLYDNEIFYFGSSKGLKEYMVDSVRVNWISEVTNTPYHHKNALSKILKSIDPHFEYNWGFPLIVKQEQGQLQSIW